MFTPNPFKSSWRYLMIPLGLCLALWTESFAFLGQEPNRPTTIRVPQDQPTIQAGIDMAQDGDLVLVAPGQYNEQLNLANKTITLASEFYTTGDESLIEQTIIDGGRRTVIFVSRTVGPETKIIGFTIQNGNDGLSVEGKLHILNNRIIGHKDGIDYETNGGGICRNNIVEGNSDDAIDLDGRVEVTIEDNILRNNTDDGIEIRLQGYGGSTLTNIIRNNIISGNGEDGIQFIDYPDDSNRFFLIEGNLIQNSAMVGVGMMDNAETIEDFRAASILERIHLFNNTFVDNPYAITGGDNLIALNNLFVGSSNIGLKGVDGNSIAAYNLFWNNTSHRQGSNVETSNSLFDQDPLLDSNNQLQMGSPAIDAGTAFFSWQGETVLDLPDTDYFGAAPDMGMFESNFGEPPPNQPPSVDAGADQILIQPDSLSLDGTVADDGLPNPPGMVTTNWSQVSGPGTVIFSDASAVDTTVTFSEIGLYVLRLTATDGELSASDDLTVTVNEQNSELTTIEVQVAASSDDAEERAGGDMNFTSDDLELVFDFGANQQVGTRFNGLTIPPGANIVNAYIQFQVESKASLDTLLSIQGEATDNAPAFTLEPGNISGRDRTTNTINWSPVPWRIKGEAGPDQRTPNLATVIQEIVDRPGWSSGNSLVILFDGYGERSAESFDGSPTGAPILHVEYGSVQTIETQVAIGSDDAEERAAGKMNLTSDDLELVFDFGGNQHVGMRFTGVDIPSGTTIINAYLQFQVESKASLDTLLSIHGEAIDNALTFTLDASNISARARTISAVNWSPTPWRIKGAAGPDQRTPNLATIIQEIVDRPGWTSGNALAIIVTGSGERSVESFDGLPAGAPILHVDYIDGQLSNVNAGFADAPETGNEENHHSRLHLFLPIIVGAD